MGKARREVLIAPKALEGMERAEPTDAEREAIRAVLTRIDWSFAMSRDCVTVTPELGSRYHVCMAHQHSPRFLEVVNDAKRRVREITVEEVKALLDGKEEFLLIDVREDNEWTRDHLPNAIHLGKGIIERDIEQQAPDLSTPMVLYCGGGFRSALAADKLQQMGYTNVASMDGGIRDWREKGYQLTTG